MDTKKMNYSIIAMIFAVIHKNLSAVLTALVVLSAGSLVILVVISALTLEPHLTYWNILAMGILVLILVMFLVLAVSIFEAEKARPTSEQNSSEFRARIIFFAFIWICFNALVWLIMTVFS